MRLCQNQQFCLPESNCQDFIPSDISSPTPASTPLCVLRTPLLSLSTLHLTSEFEFPASK